MTFFSSKHNNVKKNSIYLHFNLQSSKIQPYFFSVLLSTINGFSTKLPILLKLFRLQHLKSNPSNLIQMGTMHNSSRENSISGIQGLTMNGLLSKWFIPPCITSFLPTALSNHIRTTLFFSIITLFNPH